MEEAQVSPKDIILGRIKEALRIAAPHYHTSEQAAEHEPREWLPPTGQGFDQLSGQFAEHSKALKTEYCVHGSTEQAGAAFAEMATLNGWKKLALHRHPLTEALISQLPAMEYVFIDDGYQTSELESCDAGLTTCLALIAQTGSIAISSKANGGRALSVLPPHHIVIATKSQLVRDLPEAFANLKEEFAAHAPSMISLITGPSRTGDIERILVLGAHGPKKLTVFVTA